MAKKRLERLRLLLTLAQRKCKEAERLLAESQQRVAQAEGGLQQLRNYQLEYQQQFISAGRAGLSPGELQTYQGFIGRIGGASEQQQQALVQSRAQLEAVRQHWQQARAHANAMEKLLEKAEAEARAEADKQLQQQIDERAQHRRPNFI